MLGYFDIVDMAGLSVNWLEMVGWFGIVDRMDLAELTDLVGLVVACCVDHIWVHNNQHGKCTIHLIRKCRSHDDIEH